ncbi:SMP-30/gluconolactonase/LRE family protein [Colwellia sp. 1_MG-2023]|uniref:SMP-30/gluconolactonase/LRE family protein n=1 Tax=unclassified Colwellia TaxID=196834 RepID=UPI001C09CAF7|nr:MULTISPECIES: SMP-30/gluconolactonase/LRE family protein [unclassified Colwellia]MBU2924278.1 SMP-30/gluconolactonase/LRE family protein [Colwellia sp. C2M11]MDO6652987.1 SMP-30/gluconolactonase/LRE family protein [Colwellia sp. 3_MG-2023]MDO6665469.1 SMP-30/gluconolactonase/LRE family protein [Colwellia sp. 2_MG-2023]MDO6689772.1 SMP-30/gluconolactonase/LRE family protein [Colwellia sp. 1_MG-2023]
MTLKLDKKFDLNCGLAEGCVWSINDNAFYWIDIVKSHLYKYSLNDSSLQRFDTPEQPANIMLTQSPGLLLVSLFDGLYLFDVNKESWQLWLDVEPNKTLRINDGCVDVNGNIWLGTMLMSPDKQGIEHDMGKYGRLFKISPNKVTSIEKEVIAIFNLATFSLDNKTFFYADSFTNEIYACDFDISTSKLSKQRLFCKLADKYGHPDGGTTDSEGFIWSARWDGKGIARISPKGELAQFYPLNASQVTNVCFGGEDLKTVLVTTASLTPEGEADGGSVQLFRCDVAGILPNTVPISLNN